MSTAENGIEELQKNVDTLIVIPNQNLFRIANDKTTFADAFAMADQVLYSGVACITDLMVKEGLINLDFADVRSVMREMGKAMMGTGEASGEGRAMASAEAAIANPLLDETSMRGARGLLISITGGRDLTLFEVDEAATRIREEVDQDANIILGATFDEELEGVIRVSVVATGIDKTADQIGITPVELRQAPKLAPRASMPLKPAAPPKIEPAPEPIENDPVAEAIRMAEEDAAVATLSEPVEPAKDASFSPQSRLFQPAPEQAPAASAAPAPAPAAAELTPQPEPVMPAATLAEEPAPRMPKVEDFPPVVQAELDAHTGTAEEPQSDERGPMGLLKRLTHGLSRREEEAAGELQPAQPREPALLQNAPEPRRQAGQEAQLYAPRRGQLDDHGRLNPQQRTASEEDQLEIPAFLRRQAN